MLADADLAAVAALLGERARSTFVLSLLEGRPLPASELAARAGVSRSLASSHLSRLLEGGLVHVERCGRQRHYRLAGPQVARAIESLAAIAPQPAALSLREAARGRALRDARTCYDHLAGRLGVALTDALRHRRLITVHHDAYRVTRAGSHQLADLGLDVEALRRSRRPLTRQCLDWSERRPHLAGGLGAALAERLFALDWLRAAGTSRAVRVTDAGVEGLRQVFDLAVPLSVDPEVAKPSAE